MNDISIRQARRKDFDDISMLIARQNLNPRTHCIQSDTGKDHQAVLREMNQLDMDSALCCAAAFREDNLIGVLGCELDEPLGRGWVRGPFITEDTDEWNFIALALLRALLDILPPAIHWLDSFLNIANERGNSFYHNNGFRTLRLVHVYAAAPPLRAVPFTDPGDLCEPLTSSREQDFMTLHRTIFPQTYATGRKILDAQDDDHKVFVCFEGEELLGYLYAAIEEGGEEGVVEFVGVKPEARGRAIGQRLLRTALRWFFEVRLVSRATLVVNDDLTNARSLYERAGFILQHTGVHSRREW